MPVYNEATHIDAQLAALASQEYSGQWELVIADNGSTDDTVGRALAWKNRLPLQVQDASARRGSAFARNRAVAAAMGELLAFCDGDDIVAPGWLAAHTAALESSDLVAGAIVFFRDGEAPRDERIPTRAPTLLGWLPYAQSANASMRRATFERVGGFPEDTLYGEDVEFSWLAQLSGASFAYESAAIVHKRTPAGVRDQIRQYYRYGLWDVDLYERYRDRGVARPPARRLVRTYAGLVARIPGCLSPEVRDRWAMQVGRRAGRLVGSARRRVFYP
jgi:glycosyltransferase involved in cell wall biosynthesis